MLSLKECINSFKKHYPDLKIVDCAEYKKTNYIFAADDKYTYRVDRNTGDAYPFSPPSDMPGFLDAIRNHKVNVKGVV